MELYQFELLRISERLDIPSRTVLAVSAQLLANRYSILDLHGSILLEDYEIVFRRFPPFNLSMAAYNLLKSAQIS
jgi:hypothetical protein